MQSQATVEKWHAIVKTRDAKALSSLIAADAIFWSPVLHKPQHGRQLVLLYLGGALQVLCNDRFRYVREIVGDNDACLEFETEIDGITINGVDLFRWDSSGQIVDFKVFLRPLKGLSKVQERMAALLSSMAGQKPA